MQEQGNGSQVDHRQAHGNLMQLVSFHVGGEEFGLDILRVQELSASSS